MAKDPDYYKEYKYGNPNPSIKYSDYFKSLDYSPSYFKPVESAYYKSISFGEPTPLNLANIYADLYNAFKQKIIEESIIAPMVLQYEDLWFLLKTDPGYINQIYYKNNNDEIVLKSLETLIEIVKKYENI